MESPTVPRLLDIGDVADIFATTKKAVYQSRHLGLPPGNLGFMVGRRLRFDPDDVRAYIEEQKAPIADAGRLESPAAESTATSGAT